MATTYTCSEARYRQNGGSWWTPLSSGRTPTNTSGGGNEYETRYAFDFDAIRTTNATYSIVSAEFWFRQTNAYNVHPVKFRVASAAYADISAGSVVNSVVNNWSHISLSSADIAALVNAGATYLGTYNTVHDTYIEIYGTGTYAVYLVIDWAPRAPNPTPPPSVTAPGTVKANSKTFEWAAGSDPIFDTSELYGEIQISVDGGSNYDEVTFFTSDQGVTSDAVNLRDYLDLEALQYYYNSAMRIRVRTKTPDFGGDPYYSSWVESATFTVDYHIAPGAPASLTPSDLTPYEGETITFTLARPATYNTHDHTGAVNVLHYYVKLADGTALADATEAATSATKVISYVVGSLCAGVDLATNVRAYVVDAESQTGAECANVAITIGRFRKPALIRTQIDRNETSVDISILITDTGHGTTPQVSTQINKIEYKLSTGPWKSATLDGWSSLANSFTIDREQAFTNDPAAGANIELDMADTSGFAVDDLVTVVSSAGSETATITVVHTNTHITVNSLSLNHTSTSAKVYAIGPRSSYLLLLRAVNNEPAGTALSDLPGDSYTDQILIYIPRAMLGYDSEHGVGFVYAETLRICADPTAHAPAATDGYVEGDLEIDGNLDVAGTITNAITAAWTHYTPTISNFTKGAGGTLDAARIQIGKTVHGWVHFIFGTGSAIGTAPIMTLPIALTAAVGGMAVIGWISIYDSSGFYYKGSLFASGSLTAEKSDAAYVAFVELSAAIPMTWATWDQFEIQFCYETD